MSVVALPPFQRLLDEHGGAVYGFVLASVGPTDADDCFQETCIAAMRAYPHLDHASNLLAWFITIAQRKAIDAHRARSRRAVPMATPPEQAVPEPASPGDGQPLWARVRELPDKQRAAVFLRSVADLSYADVATALDCSQDAARRNVHEGLKALRKELVA